MQSDVKEQIRTLLSGVYDIQKVRIATGNRIVQSFYSQLGIKPSEKKEKGDEEALKMLAVLMKDYKLITDCIAENGGTVKKAIKTLPDDALSYIRSDLDFRLLSTYNGLKETEEEFLWVLKKIVHEHPMWEHFFKDVTGCGETMAAMLIAYIDIEKARHVSSVWKYCGIDTVQDVDKDGNPIFFTRDGSFRKCIQNKIILTEDGRQPVGDVKKTDEVEEDGTEIYLDELGNRCYSQLEFREVEVERPVAGVYEFMKGYTSDGKKIYKNVETGEVLTEDKCKTELVTERIPVYTIIETGEEYVGDTTECRHGRRMGDTEMREYITKDGEVALKRSLTYNPYLRSKLLTVLVGSFLKAGARYECKYEKIYRDFRSRADHNKRHEGKSDGHKHAMAVRFALREFLRDMWVAWRTLEGYEVSEPYEVEFLGRNPHGYNAAYDSKKE